MQFIGVTTAVPVVFLLVMTVWTTMRTYRFTRAQLALRYVLRDGLALALDNPSGFDRDDLATTRGAVAALGGTIKGVDLAMLDREEMLAEEMSVRLFGEADAREILGGLPERRAHELERSRQKLDVTLKTRTPTTVARWREFLIGREIAKIMATSFRHVGVRTVGVLLRRAGQDVTAGSVVGLVGAIVVWFLASQYRGDFNAYIGGGVTLGAFFGLAFTAVSLVREMTGATWRLLLLVWCLVAAYQSLTFLDPGWWPMSPGP